MGIKERIREDLPAARQGVWLAVKFGLKTLPIHVAEVANLEQDLEMVIGIEKAAFMYAMIKVNGSTQKVAEMHWENYQRGQ